MTESQIAAIRARLNFEQESEFIEAFAPLISAGGMFLRTRQIKPVGSTIRFDFSLADGERLLFGEGLVRQVRQPTPQNPRSPSGMLIKFTKLNRASKDLIRRVMLYKQQMQLGDESEEEPSPQETWGQDDHTRAGMPLYDDEAELASTFDPNGRTHGDVRTSLANLQALQVRRRDDGATRSGSHEPLERDATPVPSKYTAPHEERQRQTPAVSSPNLPGVAPPEAPEAPEVPELGELAALLPPGSRISEVAEEPAQAAADPRLGEFGLGMEEDEIDDVLGNLFGGGEGNPFGWDAAPGAQAAEPEPEPEPEPAPILPTPLAPPGARVVEEADDLFMGADDSEDDSFLPSSMPVPMAPPRPLLAPEDEGAEEPAAAGGLGAAVDERFFDDEPHADAPAFLQTDEGAPAFFGDPEAERVMARQRDARRVTRGDSLFPNISVSSPAEDDMPISVADPVSEEQAEIQRPFSDQSGFIDLGPDEESEHPAAGFADEAPPQEEACEVSLSAPDDEDMPFPGFADEEAPAPARGPDATARRDDEEVVDLFADDADAAPEDDGFFIDLDAPPEDDEDPQLDAAIPAHLLVPAHDGLGVDAEEEAEVARLYNERDEEETPPGPPPAAESKPIARIQLKRAGAEEPAATPAEDAAAPEPPPGPAAPPPPAAPRRRRARPDRSLRGPRGGPGHPRQPPGRAPGRSGGARQRRQPPRHGPRGADLPTPRRAGQHRRPLAGGSPLLRPERAPPGGGRSRPGRSHPG